MRHASSRSALVHTSSRYNEHTLAHAARTSGGHAEETHCHEKYEGGKPSQIGLSQTGDGNTMLIQYKACNQAEKDTVSLMELLASTRNQNKSLKLGILLQKALYPI